MFRDNCRQLGDIFSVFFSQVHYLTDQRLRRPLQMMVDGNFQEFRCFRCENTKNTLWFWYILMAMWFLVLDVFACCCCNLLFVCWAWNLRTSRNLNSDPVRSQQSTLRRSWRYLDPRHGNMEFSSENIWWKRHNLTLYDIMCIYIYTYIYIYRRVCVHVEIWRFVVYWIYMCFFRVVLTNYHQEAPPRQAAAEQW